MGQLYILFMIVGKLDPLVNNKYSNKSVKTTEHNFFFRYTHINNDMGYKWYVNLTMT